MTNLVILSLVRKLNVGFQIGDLFCKEFSVICRVKIAQVYPSEVLRFRVFISGLATCVSCASLMCWIWISGSFGGFDYLVSYR